MRMILSRVVMMLVWLGGWNLEEAMVTKLWAQESQPSSQPTRIKPQQEPKSHSVHPEPTSQPVGAIRRDTVDRPGELSAAQLVRVRAAVKEYAETLRTVPKTRSFPCQPTCRYQAKVVWSVPLAEVAESSPRAVDLNEDGVLDIVLGSGVFGLGGGPNGFVYAVNGRDGSLLWKTKFSGDVYATPTFLRINQDKIPDVVMAGRFDNVYAIDGKTGKILWDLKTKNPSVKIPRANFNTTVPIADLDQDGVPDLLTVQGGEVVSEGITIGHLYQISGRTGKIIRMMMVPDQREIYSTPAYWAQDKQSVVYIGTGGERIPGHLMALEFPSFREVWRYASFQKGYIASPIVTVFPGKSYPDVVNAGFDGRLVRVDGKNGQKVWEHVILNHETYTSPGIGRFSGPTGKDVIVAYYQGVWPRYQKSHLFWIRGDTGKLIAKRALGTYSLSSPLVADLNGDGWDEVILSTNDVDHGMTRKLDKLVNIIRPALGPPEQLQQAMTNPEKRPAFLPKDMPTYTSPYFAMRNTLLIIDGKTKQIHWSQEFPKYSSSTPLLVDIDANGKMDLVYAYLGHLVRFEFAWNLSPSELQWNQFRGLYGDGVLRSRR